MDLNYSTTNLFPTIIHQFDVNDFDEIKDDLIKYAYIKRHNDAGHIISPQSLGHLIHNTPAKSLVG